MGRIEEALAKLRTERAAPPASSAPIGRIVERDFSYPEAVKHAYGGKPIHIDPHRLADSGLLAPDKFQRRLEDQYRAVKRPLLKNASSSQGAAPVPYGNLLMVASAIPGEGKTFTSVNICLSIAREKDWSVVLIDGDCGKPHLSRLFGAESEPGLLDLLSDESKTFDSLVMPTNIPNLSFLPNGRRDPQAAELFSSARMERLCTELKDSDPRRMIVFDTAPLLLVAESAVLATRVGQVILVVKAFETPSQAVLAARDKLDPTKAINLLLNQTSYETGPPGYAGYGYYEDAAV